MAEATAKADSINIGGVLKILSGAAHAKVVRSATSELRLESSLVVHGLSIAGQAVGFGSGALLMRGSAQPIPDESPLMQPLSEARITTAQYLNLIEHDNGVVSPGFVVHPPVPVPRGCAQHDLHLHAYMLGRT